MRKLFLFPFFEYLAKLINIRIGNIKFLLQFRKRFHKTKILKTNAKSIDEIVIKSNVLKNLLYDIGLNEKTNLVLHSSMSGIKFDKSDENFVNELINLFPQGSLSIPTIPLLRRDKINNSFLFDISRSKSTTGRLSNVLLKLPNSCRSSFPLNNITSIGSNANHIIGDESTFFQQKSACDRHSPWYRLYELDAVMLFINVFPAHAMTMIHVAEESFNEVFPIPDSIWYNNINFTIVKKDGSSVIRILQERYHHWSIHYAETKLNHDLLKLGILKRYTINDVELYFCHSKELVSFLLSKRPSVYPYFFTKIKFSHV